MLLKTPSVWKVFGPELFCACAPEVANRQIAQNRTPLSTNLIGFSFLSPTKTAGIVKHGRLQVNDIRRARRVLASTACGDWRRGVEGFQLRVEAQRHHVGVREGFE